MRSVIWLASTIHLPLLLISFVTCLSQALKRTLSFNKFIKGYQSLLYRIQKRYGIKEPTTALQFNELMEYVERLNSECFLHGSRFSKNSHVHAQFAQFTTHSLVLQRSVLDNFLEGRIIAVYSHISRETNNSLFAILVKKVGSRLSSHVS